jgi:tRNA 2-thiocytidine biosynthesis protein TtcA
MGIFKEISVADLGKSLSKGLNINILDIRTEAQRAIGFIPDSLHYDVYERLKAGDSHAFENLALPKTTQIVAYCGGGELSKFAATLLLENGFDAYSLSGGYNAWTTDLEQVN